MRRCSALPILTLFALLLVAGAAGAQGAPTELGVFGDWRAFQYDENGSPVCYMMTQPTKSEGNYAKRGEVHALVTHRPATGQVGVFTFGAGYEIKPDSKPKVTVGDTAIALFPAGENGWARNDDDPKLVAAMKGGAKMIITGTSARGTDTKDTFSLSGFTKAYEAIGKACGV